jgi:GT2 family glycosyltransferase
MSAVSAGRGGVSDVPSVSAVVCTRDRPHMMPGCLENLAAALSPDDEIVVVEAGDSAVASALASVSARQRTVHVRADRPGTSLLLLTDDDVRLDPAWRDLMVAAFSDPAVGVVCGRIEGLHHGVRPPPGAAADQPFEAPFATWEYAHGALMGLRAAAAWHVGGFDERLGPGAPAHGEEHDLLLRARERGWRVMVASAAAARHLDWRDDAANRKNALVYERGGGAFVGTALRRSPRSGVPVLAGRLRYQRWLFGVDWRFALKALPAFTSGLAYGIRRPERAWLVPGGGPVGADPRGQGRP